MKTLSKSSYCNGLQCPKILWLKTHCPQEAQTSESTQNAFDSGHTVGGYAKTYFGDYVEVPMDFDNYSKSLKVALETTKSLIYKGTQTICEAAFKFENVNCFADIVRVNTNGSIEIIEVKQSTGLKQQYLDDMAFQYYVIKNCGYNISKISLMCIDNSYVRNGDIEPRKLFKIIDCTQEILAKQQDIPERIENMLQYSEQKDEPEMVPTDKQCLDPYQCAFWEYCRGKKEYEKEVEKEEYPEMFNKSALQDFLSEIRYPLYYLDFETLFNEPIPPIDGTRPYQKITFQYSLHIQKTKDEDINDLEHREFLANEMNSEEVRMLAEKLCEDIPKDAMIMAYNAIFEKGCIEELARLFPDLSKHLLNLRDNFIDLMKPFRSKHLQTPEMQGSYSIKYVLPALVPELVYSDLEVQNGNMACETFKTLKDLSTEEEKNARNALLAYCKLDTFAMVKILNELKRLCES
jgi:hypothetical protein